MIFKNKTIQNTIFYLKKRKYLIQRRFSEQLFAIAIAIAAMHFNVKCETFQSAHIQINIIWILSHEINKVNKNNLIKIDII